MSIEINKVNANIFFESNDIYEIPSYQREYKWKKEDVKLFIEDLINFSKELNDSNYFFGMILREVIPFSKEKEIEANFYLIDGQQRITTFFLLRKAIIDLKYDISEKEISRTKLYEEIFCSKNFNNKFKLKNKNKTFYNYIFNPANLNEEKKINLNKNYFTIFEKIKDEFSTMEKIEKFENSLKKIIFSIVEINNDQNAEEIFENLNSKGKKLSLSELMKNKFLLINNVIYKKNIKENSENIFLEKEKNFKFEERIIELFLKIEEFQNKIKSKNENWELYYLCFKKENDILRSMMSWIFQNEIPANEDNKQFIDIIKNLQEKNYHYNYINFEKLILKMENILLNFEVCNGIISIGTEASFYLYWIFNKSSAFNIIIPNLISQIIEKNNIKTLDSINQNHVLILKDIKKIFSIIAKSSMLSNGFSGINLWKQIAVSLNEEINLNNLSELMEFVLNSNQTLSNDFVEKIKLEDFENSILNFEFYTWDKNLLKSLFFLIENKINQEKNIENINWDELFKRLKSPEWNIEYIFPKKIDRSKASGEKWNNDLGNQDYISVINKIGNLSILNFKMPSQKKELYFDEKKIYFKNTGLSINNDLSEYEKFDITIYKKRALELKNYIVDILN